MKQKSRNETMKVFKMFILEAKILRKRKEMRKIFEFLIVRF